MKHLLIAAVLSALSGCTKIIEVREDGTIVEKVVTTQNIEIVYLNNGRAIECIKIAGRMSCNWEKYNHTYEELK